MDLARLRVVFSFLLLSVGFSSRVVFAEGEENIGEEVEYTVPQLSGLAHVFEPFETEETLKERWIVSEAKKDGVDSEIAKYDGKWSVEEPSEKRLAGDLALVLKSKAKHHAISIALDEKFEFSVAPLVVQYEIKFQIPMECGGAYLKLISHSEDLKLSEFQDQTPYTIMFGPDKCGGTKKIHFIFRHKNPKTGEYEEKHAKAASDKFDHMFDDKKSHLLRLVVSPDNRFEVFLDRTSINSGSLLSDVQPPVNPPAEVDDADDKKSEDWDEREKIPDPDAEKPEDWNEDAPTSIPDVNAKKPEDWLDDEPKYIPDPNAEKPSDWDDEEDGEWEPAQIANPKCEKSGCGEWTAPMIDNPEFKGKWSAPLIANPDYQGIWKPKRIANPDFFEDKEPFKMTSIAAVGFELWSMTEDILFDNLLVTDDISVADKLADDSWSLKVTKDSIISGEGSIVSNLMEATKERPWLWVLYAVVVILPFILIAACCFPSTKTDETARKKKTDEATEDIKDDAKEDDEKESDDKEENNEEEDKKDENKEDEDKKDEDKEDEDKEDEDKKDEDKKDEDKEDEDKEDEDKEDEDKEDEDKKDEGDDDKKEDGENQETTSEQQDKNGVADDKKATASSEDSSSKGDDKE